MERLVLGPEDLGPEDARRVLGKIRFTLAVFMAGLVASGITAFPLQAELDLVVRMTGAQQLASHGGLLADLAAWILKVQGGLTDTYARYPFIAYGTDWLAFGHLVIAHFFIGPMLDPMRNVFILKTGLWACLLVLPLALICGPIRGIPLGWRLVDCSFGICGFPLLWYCLRLTRLLPAWNPATNLSAGR